MAKNRKTTERLYSRYEYLANAYAKKIYDFERLGWEREDVVQEFRAKIWYSIKRYVKKWKEYKETGKYKPVPLPFFIQSNLNRLIIDLTKKINGYYVDSQGKGQKRINGVVSMAEVNFDMGIEDSMTTIDMAKDKVIVRGVDFLQGLSKNEKKVFKMFLKGHTIKNITAMMPGLDVSSIINKQKTQLKKHEQELLEPSFSVKFVFQTEED